MLAVIFLDVGKVKHIHQFSSAISVCVKGFRGPGDHSSQYLSVRPVVSQSIHLNMTCVEHYLRFSMSHSYLCVSAGVLSETAPQVRTVTSERDRLTQQLAESSSERDALSEQLSDSEAKCNELMTELESLAQQLTSSEAKSTDLSEQLSSVSQSLSSSNTRITELESELQLSQQARSRVESELELLKQQSHGVHVDADSAPTSSGKEAQESQKELDALRSAIQDRADVMAQQHCCHAVCCI